MNHFVAAIVLLGLMTASVHDTVGAAETARERPGVAQTACGTDPGWDDPAPPQRIFGNTWYVGTCGISSVLITSPQGHVLIDGATEKSAATIARNIVDAGFRIDDVRFLLVSHAHLDHVGGIAELQARSGAIVVSRGADADALERGRGDRSDPQYLTADPFQPVASVRRIQSGEAVTIGELSIRAHATTGHTPGSTSWSWKSCEGARCLDLVYADSLTPISDPSFRYTDDASHPNYLSAFQASIAAVARLPCDVLLTPHPGASFLLARLAADGRARFVDPVGCRRYADFANRALKSRVKQERGG